MNLLPYFQETLVSPLSKEALLSKLAGVTHVQGGEFHADELAQKVFNGRIGADHFRISRRLKKGDTFLPLIVGSVENTPRGSLLFLRYRLFPSVLFFMSFWSLVLLAFALYYFFVPQSWSYGGLCIFLALFNYGMGVFFFQRQLGICRELVQDAITIFKMDSDLEPSL
ncbi:MAG: hypothetical protein O2829_07045 [Bacteroidetes bacterium]|nr:hypothetical protein [Bacteroidota bacterium]MDA1268833.1 hypothetical protein [Bacteroidota bacterium]